jgi:hypothetical protein
MEIKLQCGDTINIPECCKAIVKDGCVVIEKGQEFKDGDILVSVENGERYNAFIYKSTDKRGFHSYYVGLDVCGQLSISDSPSDRWCSSSLSYATEEEKQLLFDKMKEQGLRWNAEEKRVEHIRWRAKKGERYYSINLVMQSIRFVERGDICDNGLWNALVYFRTEEQAKEAVKRVKETLRQYHEEIGG